MDGWSVPILLKYIHSTYLQLIKGLAVDCTPDESYGNAQQYLQDNKKLNDEFWTSYVGKIDFHEDLNSLLKPEKQSIKLSEYKHIKEPCEIELLIDGECFHRLRTFCQTYGFTLNAVMQYCWHKLLSIYDARKTTIVGTTVSGRNLPINDIEHSVGLYINTLPVIFEHNEGKVIDLISELQDNINEINSRSDVNLAELHGGGSRLFNSLFVFENYPMDKESNIGDSLKLSIGESVEKVDYPLCVTSYEQNEKLVFKLQYAAEIFDVRMIEQLVNGINILISQLLENPAIESRELSFVTKEQFNQLVYDWNDTEREYPSDKPLHVLFEEQVFRTPDNTAVVYEDVRLTYRELNERANRLAFYLNQKYTVKPDDLVMLCLDRSEKMLVSILAILKTGAAYVPVDMSYPDERLVYIVADTKTKFVLSNEVYAKRLESIIDSLAIIVEAIDSEAMEDKLNICPIENIKTETDGSNLAYVIYTSGTTGQPKGVMVEHKNIANLIYHLPSHYNFAPNEVVLFLSNYVFDTSIEQIFIALLHGHKLLIVPNNFLENENQFINTLTQEKVTHVDFTPSLLQQLSIESITTLRRIISGGEHLNIELFNRLNNRHFLFYNSYGLTETTVTSTVSVLHERISIGYPVSNVKVYILNEHISVLPIGVVGELYIGGAGITRGYLNRPELTDERFINNPFQTDEEKEKGINSKIYKSGDLVKRSFDGSIEYVGRNDLQVKIRGFRIELGEIETQILKYPNIKQTIVIAKDHINNNKYLVAYYVSNKDIDSDEMRYYLSNNLPEYMIPQVFVPLTTIPLTINGKVNIKALPEPQTTYVKNYVAPVSNNEKQICKLLSKILGINYSEISIDDNFLSLGGNSIFAIKFVNMLNKEFHSTIKISDIHTAKSISDIGKLVETRKYQSIVQFNNLLDNKLTNLYMIHPGGAGCEVYISLAQKLKHKYNCYGIDSYNLYNEEKIIDLNNLAFYYIEQIENQDGRMKSYEFLGWSLGGLISLEIAYILESRGIKNIKIYLLDTVIIDPILNNLLQTCYNDKVIYEEIHNIKKYNLNLDNINNWVTAEESIANQTLSGKLKYTKIILFKSTLGDTKISQEANEYIKNLKYNNLENFIDSNQINVIFIPNSNHSDIIKREDEIIEHLIINNK
jgi:amino acid adenylation domain-containing protein